MSFATKRARAERGFSLVELLIVIAILISVAAYSIPNIIQATYNVKLRSAAGDLAGLMQQARILAAKNNGTYAIAYTTVNGQPVAFVDLNGNGSYDAATSSTPAEPLIPFNGSVQFASGAPSGSGGQPPAYTYIGDTGTGAFDNATTLAFSPRGLPCAYDSTTSPPTCATPAAKYFVYYLNDSRPFGAQGWAAILVTKAGRTHVELYNGGIWH